MSFVNLLDWVSPPPFQFFVESVAAEKCKNEICYLINLFDLQLLPVGKVSVFQIMNWSMVCHILAIITRYNCLRHVFSSSVLVRPPSSISLSPTPK